MNVSTRLALLLGACSALVAVIWGAFGAHGLRPLISADLLAVFETGVRYQFYHALGLILVALIGKVNGNSVLLRWSVVFFALGIVVFCGSLYLLALTQWRKWGMVTPIGGLSFILGWLCLIVYGVKHWRD